MTNTDTDPGLYNPQPTYPGGQAQIPTGPQMQPPPVAQGGGLDFMSDPVYQNLEHAGQDLMQGQRQNTMGFVRSLDRDRRDMAATPQPQLQAAPQAPPQQLGKGLMEFMQVATVLGALAGGKARTGATAALNAFGAAVKGFAEGNKEVFQSNLEEWKAASEQVKADNQAKLDQYDLIWRNKKLSMDQKMAEFKIIAQQYQDEITYNLAEQRNYTQLAQANEREKQWQQNFDLRYQNSLRASEGVNMRLGELQDRKDQGVEIADGIRSGEIPPTPAYMGTYQTKNYTMQELAKSKFNLQKAQLEWQAAQKQIQSLYGPQMTRYFGLADSVVNTIDETKALAEEMQNSGVPLLNRAKLAAYIQAEGNSEKGQLAARYMAAVNTLKEEFANLAQGGYAPTEPVWQLANQQINADYGVKELGASLTEIQRLLRYRMKGLTDRAGGLAPGKEPNRYMGTQGTDPGLAQPPQQQNNDGWSIVK